ncbi:hypothetical protein MKZ20_19800 [Psychrobacillus sp. FSL K6-2684]|uniref:DUF3185 domain-containing protein n=1 Tax=Psychrobacillus faecigallinarum TaxID=2762235 RepID=A0ABR8RCL3_9BACI|nr:MULTISPECIES: DUF3185 domain-containing protein [Psychrobacillus]MBD7945475.1 DUF3185 domain-containing protein [Psychrobacillus faecigallinarum]QEY21670.1 DUF3185 domain-containing protein [Psychrobacillus sp. AK 1817]
MNKLYTIVRFLLGFMMIGSGIFMFVAGGFTTEYENETAQLYMNAMEETGFFIPMLAIVKIICGLSFVTKRFMPLALLIFMSLAVNMVVFHIFLEPFTGFPAYFIFIMTVFLMVRNFPDYRNLLQAKAIV